VTSLRTRLFVALVAMTVLVWSIAAGWTYVRTQADVERVLDARLVEAARMVSSLAASGAVAKESARAAISSESYNRQLSCQIWTLRGRLVARSGGAPSQRLSNAPAGFSETQIGGETWRVYTVPRPDVGLRVMVGDNLRVRRRLISQVITGVLLPAAAGVVALAVLLWIVVDRALAPLQAIAAALVRRPAADLSPIEADGAADELRPMLSALNSLFDRLAAARVREAHLTASAAHELKTPLAGLKAQAQIALTSADTEVRLGALKQILLAVDRASRLVAQLLEMARQDAEQTVKPRPSWVSLRRAWSQVALDLAPAARARGVRLEFEDGPAEIHVAPEFLQSALRNLLENAVQYANSRVVGRLERAGPGWRLIIEDDGPGILAEDLARVRERFYRGRRARGVGSGLGLSIVDLAIRHADLSLELSRGDLGGLAARILVPERRLRQLTEPEVFARRRDDVAI
jgi:two-component system sensor histidine kinase QseC